MTDSIAPPVGPGARVRGCPPPEHIAALAGDALPADLRQSIESHVARCAACRALAADLALLADVDAPGSLDARVHPVAQSRGRWALLAAAALLAAIGLSTLWRVRSPEPLVQSAALAAPQPAPPSTIPAPPLGSWTVEKPPIELPVATAIVMRGADPSGAAALPAALEPYQRDDFAGAAARLTEFTTAHPGSPDGWFYLGASRLLAGDASGARLALEKSAALGAGFQHPQLAWLLATADARTGALYSARTRLDALCAVSSALRSRACDARKTLP